MRQLVLKIVLVAAVATCLGNPARVAAQAPTDASAPSIPQATGPSQLKVFLDCDGCYSDFLQSEIEFVDYVRDRTEAEVHLLITRAQTGSGGGEYTLAFIGRGRFDGRDRDAQDGDRKLRHRRHRAPAARELGARRPAAIPDARRRAAAPRDRGEARNRAAAARRRRRPLEQLGVQRGGLGRVPG